MHKIFIQQIALPPVCRKEVLRYSGAKNQASEGLSALIDECIAESGNTFGKVCYTILSVEDFYSLIPYAKDSADLSRYLQNASKIVLFAATIGIEIDRLLHRYSAVSPTKALIFQAIGAERIEATCDEFCNQLPELFAGEGVTNSRFSAGYGDFSIEAQREIFSILTPEKHIGVTLTDSMLMSPTKSVTAIVKITNEPFKESNQTQKCISCENQNCAFRQN